MWQPEPGWQRLPGGPSTLGVWLAHDEGRPVVVKRFSAPTPLDPPPLSDVSHPAYWCRAVEVARSGAVEETRGLCAMPALRVEEDAEGVTLVQAWTDEVVSNGLVLASALGRFATNPAPPVVWLARGQLAARIAQVAGRGGWSTLARTPVADLADLLWQRREHLLVRLADQPQVLQHGDPVPANLRGRRGGEVVAIDWSNLGLGPLGADLGYLALGVREEFEPLLDAYLVGYAEASAATVDVDAVRRAARATMAFTVLTRVDWALSRAAPGEGALAGKYRHPSVAPYIAAMQRQFPQIEALAEGL